MNKVEFGKKKILCVRDYWPREDVNFTPWLSKEIEYLNEALNLDINPIGIEQPAGSLSIDILAKDEFNNKVIIENQYNKTDHDHLGKMLTYLAYHEAKTAIWICEEPRPEHEKVITWLNENTVNDFYLVKMEIIKIDDSRPYPSFIKICGPSKKAKLVRKDKVNLDESQERLFVFWQKFLDKLSELYPEHAGGRPSKNNWILRSAGKGIDYIYLIFKEKAALELNFDSNNPKVNDDRFKKFEARKVDIEKEFGEKLAWNFKEGRTSQKIRYEIKEGGILNEELLNNIQTIMINKMKKLVESTQKHIAEL